MGNADFFVDAQNILYGDELYITSKAPAESILENPQEMEGFYNLLRPRKGKPIENMWLTMLATCQAAPSVKRMSSISVFAIYE